MRKWITRILICVGALALLLRLANWGVRSSHTLPVPPQPNGYEELVAAVRGIKPLPSDFAELSSEQIRQLTQLNQSSLEKVRTALAMDSGVTLETKKGWQDQHEQDLKDLKRLAVALGVESKSLLQTSHTNEAARCNLEVIRLAQSLSRGGILLDGFTGLAIEMIGASSLQAMLPQLDATFCREASRALEELLAKREPPETILATERAWSARRFGLVDSVGGLLGRQANAKRFTQFVQKAHETTARTQRLMLRLAARAYELDVKQPLAKVADLVPKYLKAAPLDPETGKEIQEIPLPVK